MRYVGMSSGSQFVITIWKISTILMEVQGTGFIQSEWLTTEVYLVNSW